MAALQTARVLMRKTEKEDVKQIVRIADLSAEVRLLLKACALEVEEAYNEAKQTKQTIEAVLASKRRSADGDDADDDADDDGKEPPFEIGADETLHRNLINLKPWGKKLLADLLYYCAPKSMNRHALRQCTRELCKQLVCYAFDCQSTGAVCDKVGTLSKKELFNSMRHIHRQKGSKLKGLDPLGGFIDWTEQGHYAISTEADDDEVKYYILTKALNSTVELPAELRNDAELKTSDIIMNFSQLEATIPLLNSDFRLQNLFPMLGTILKRGVAEDGPKLPLRKRVCRASFGASGSPVGVAQVSLPVPVLEPAETGAADVGRSTADAAAGQVATATAAKVAAQTRKSAVALGVPPEAALVKA